MTIVFLIAAARLLLLLLTASRYGYFGDELYFLACSEHLDWGYVDQPPLIALIVRLERVLTGDSLLSLRFLPALSGSAKVVLAGLMARQFGARRFGMALAALATACAGIFLAIDHLITMNAFEPLFWMGCAYILMRIIQTGNQKLWLWFGAVAGLGLQNKYSLLVFGFGVAVGLLATRQRRFLKSRWIWLGGALAFLIFLPNLIWNVQHHWPFIELTRNVRLSGKDIAYGPASFIAQQILLMTPLTFPIWLAGLLWLFFSERGRAYRVLGWAFAVTFGVFLLSKSKNYYVAPAYPVVFAAGGLALDEAIDRIRQAWLRPVFVVLLLAATALLLPTLIPVLPVDAYLRYQDKLPFALPATERSHLSARLPHHFAWQFGWEEMTAGAARAYYSLPPEERPKAAIFGQDFGQAGAIDFFGPRYGLPKAIGGHQNYWLWGPRNYTGEVMIVLGDTVKGASRHFADVRVAAEVNNPYARPGVNRPVLICRQPNFNLQEAWPKLKNWH
jgi:4-amino-4-deoxy-L-arabinose transferase-like glycosyltransferase